LRYCNRWWKLNLFAHESKFDLIWIGAEETAPTRPRAKIASTKAMLIVFWGIRGVTLLDWLSQGASFNGAYFDEHILQVMASELHAGEEKKHCLWSLVHMDNARLHTSKRNLARMEELRFKHVPIRLLALISHHRTSFSSDGSKASSLLNRSASSMGFWDCRCNSVHSHTWHNREGFLELDRKIDTSY
jgi:hypothetical protein